MKLMKNVGGYDKQELRRVMGVIEDTLKSHWSDHEGFVNLQERLLALRMILDENGDGFVQGIGHHVVLIATCIYTIYRHNSSHSRIRHAKPGTLSLLNAILAVNRHK